ncbi:CapA family protein [Halomonas sp. DP5N14-9]|uniref:CapA family protein n=1 Tax=Halomonas sp. DP5N14-9 TaxID=2859075 RepID=UPI001C9965EE|nr:CapA family protein [Halomonas sp. DP5N14-9]MBY5941292.1 CapA family protein [Halomonas sp. DP5N14-9]
MLSFTGDFYTENPIHVKINAKGRFVVNLESPLTDNTISPALDKVNLRMREDNFFSTFSPAPVAVCLANNHIFDFGDVGLEDTLRHLNKAGVSYFGVGDESNNFNNPFRYEEQNCVIEVFGYCDDSTTPANGTRNKVSPLRIDRIKCDLRCSSADKKIVCLHWGDEENKYPAISDISLARHIIDSGADVVIGHHAHVIQSHEVYKGKNIYYNVGNFAFDDLDVPASWDGYKYKNRYKKKQRKNNKVGLIVDVSIDGIAARGVKYRDRVVSETYKVRVFGLPSFSVMHTLINRKNTMIIMMDRFLKNPRIPSFSQFKRFFGG